MIKLLLSGFMLAPKIRAKNAKIAGPFRQARKEDRPPSGTADQYSGQI